MKESQAHSCASTRALLGHHIWVKMLLPNNSFHTIALSLESCFTDLRNSHLCCEGRRTVISTDWLTDGSSDNRWIQYIEDTSSPSWNYSIFTGYIRPPQRSWPVDLVDRLAKVSPIIYDL